MYLQQFGFKVDESSVLVSSFSQVQSRLRDKMDVSLMGKGSVPTTKAFMWLLSGVQAVVLIGFFFLAILVQPLHDTKVTI